MSAAAPGCEDRSIVGEYEGWCATCIECDDEHGGHVGGFGAAESSGCDQVTGMVVDDFGVGAVIEGPVGGVRLPASLGTSGLVRGKPLLGGRPLCPEPENLPAHEYRDSTKTPHCKVAL